MTDAKIDEAERDAAFAATVARHPDAFVLAVSPAGLFADLPETFEPGRLRPVTGPRSALDLVVPDDHPAVIDAWHTFLARGLAQCRVRPLSAPDQLVELQMIDLSHRYGVPLVLLTGLDGHPAHLPLEHQAIKPRLVTVRKSSHAVIVGADPEIVRVLGWTADELLGTRAVDLVHPDDRVRAISSWMDMLASPSGEARRVRLRHLHRDGSVVWFEVTNHNQLTAPGVGEVVAEMLDISDEMAAQEALRAGEQLMRRLTETIPMGIVQIGTDRRIAYQNERAARALGAGVGELLGGPLLDRILPGDRPAIDAAIDAVLREGRDVDAEYGYRNEQRGLRRVRAGLRALNGPDGEVTGAIICLTDVTDDVRLRDELKQRATYDALTGCRNRASTLTALQEALDDPARTRGIAVIFIDLNRFKQVNDVYGHATGDRLLTHVASRLRGAVRDGDVVGRFGGDEFVVICPEVPGAAEARHIGQSLVAALVTGGLEVNGERLLPQASIGVAWARTQTCADTLIARADAAMYEAKKSRTGRLALALAD
ncbi:diguanylate cyclase [Couchioplanes caeruleus]|uniref:GGDEF domain-containing protein n=1 Tax=Couchioplanes caeruleus TaxID=56438 RepID=UPI0020C152C1|nr:GGDEF domain-containing protein [Couchioplanes caeruleus]UQU61228.1 diguanylate cyclase [Couchioplanes caeruleus]